MFSNRVTDHRHQKIEQVLMERVRNGARDVIEVTMNEGKAVRAIPGQISAFFISGLGGCQGTLVLTKCRDGKPLAILTHFDPLHIGANMTRLGQLIKENSLTIDPNAKHRVFFSVPGEWVKKDDKYIMEAEAHSSDKIQHLRTTLKAKLGKNFEEVVMPYSEDIQFGESRALIANFDKSNPNKIRIQAVGDHYHHLEL